MIELQTVNFANLWQHYKAEDNQGRIDSAVDLAFWENAAQDYDRSHDPCVETQAMLRSLLRPSDSLLDVGAGTGRFALPLASSVKKVTALDHSPAMLHVLKQNVASQKISNILPVQAEWENSEIAPHDVVIAAWSLYRHVDINLAIQKLVEVTKRTLIIIESDDDSPHYPHHTLKEAIWGSPERTHLSKYLCFLGVLSQLGLRADLQIVYEKKQVGAHTPEAIARQLAPNQATDAEISQFTTNLTPMMRSNAMGWHYTYTYPVEMIIWHKDKADPHV